MAGSAPQIHQVTTDETRNISVDMSGFLADDETLVGTPLVSTDPSIDIENKQINTAIVSINNRDVDIGRAVLFQATAGTKGSYVLDITCATSADQTIEGRIRLNVRRSGT